MSLIPRTTGRAPHAKELGQVASLRSRFVTERFARISPGTRRYGRVLAGAVFALTVFAFIAANVRQSLDKGIHNPNDFVTLYAGSVCLTEACNPYNIPVLDNVLVQKRGTEIRQEWTDQLPIYPPTTLFLLLPFSRLSYATATTVWYVLSLSVYAAGLLWAFLFSSYLRGQSRALRGVAVLLGVHFPKLVQCLSFGNPSVLVTGLMLFAVFDAPHSRFRFRVICAAIACMLKPPLALPLMLLLVFRDSDRLRQSFLAMGAFFSAVAWILLLAFLPGGMHHWLADLRTNISMGQHGGMNPSIRISPSNTLLNVAVLPGYFTNDPRIIKTVTLLIAGTCVALFCFAIARLYRRRDWLTRGYAVSVPTLAILSLLPVYHRFCDIGLVLFVIPWLIHSLSTHPRWHSWLSLPILFLLYFSWERRISLDHLRVPARHVVEFLYYRGDPLLLLALTCILLLAMYSVANQPDQGPWRPLGRISLDDRR